MATEFERYTPVLLLTGYLGSGKTTLLNRILSNNKNIKFAVIVNDIGEINIDATLIANQGIVNGADGDLVALQNGCICCSLQTDLMKQLGELCDGRFDYIVIEASGVCEPLPIARTIETMTRTIPDPAYQGTLPKLDSIICVVDALRLQTEFNCGHFEIEEDNIQGLIMEQIEFSNKIILNKIDEVGEMERKEIETVLRELQPSAEIICTSWCDVPMNLLLKTSDFNFGETAMAARWIKEFDEYDPAAHGENCECNKCSHHHDNHHDNHAHAHCSVEHHHPHEDNHEHSAHDHLKEFDISTKVYFRRDAFDFEKFDRFVNFHWPKQIIRTKGIVYFSHNTDMSLLFEQAGVQKRLQESGLWLATAPADELKAMIEQDPSILKDWDTEYGARMIKLVFIGRNADWAELFSKLDNCLARRK